MRRTTALLASQVDASWDMISPRWFMSVLVAETIRRPGFAQSAPPRSLRAIAPDAGQVRLFAHHPLRRYGPLGTRQCCQGFFRPDGGGDRHESPVEPDDRGAVETSGS